MKMKFYKPFIALKAKEPFHCEFSLLFCFWSFPLEWKMNSLLCYKWSVATQRKYLFHLGSWYVVRRIVRRLIYYQQYHVAWHIHQYNCFIPTWSAKKGSLIAFSHFCPLHFVVNALCFVSQRQLSIVIPGIPFNGARSDRLYVALSRT